MNSCNCEAGVVASPAQYNKATSCPNPPTQLNTIIIPKEKGGDGPTDPYAPKLGAEQNKIVVYEKTGSVYIYDVNGIYTNLTGESLANVIAALQQQLDDLTTTVTGVQESVATETSNREAAVAELTASIQALQTALANEASSREAEDTSLSQQIATISASSGDVSTALAAETQAREAADTALQEALAAEANAREQADASLETSMQDLTNTVADKQDTLISGVNIKTVNGASLLGEGNVDISGGGESFVMYQQYTPDGSNQILKSSGAPLIQTFSVAYAWGTISAGYFDFVFTTPFASAPTVSATFSVSSADNSMIPISSFPTGFSIIPLDTTTEKVELRYTMPALPSQLTGNHYIRFHVIAIGIAP